MGGVDWAWGEYGCEGGSVGGGGGFCGYGGEIWLDELGFRLLLPGHIGLDVKCRHTPKLLPIPIQPLRTLISLELVLPGLTLIIIRVDRAPIGPIARHSTILSRPEQGLEITTTTIATLLPVATVIIHRDASLQASTTQVVETGCGEGLVGVGWGVIGISKGGGKLVGGAEGGLDVLEGLAGWGG